MSEGNGILLVTAVGMNSEWGILYSKLISPREDTPMQIFLAQLAKYVGWIGTGVAVLVLVVLLIRYTVVSGL